MANNNETDDLMVVRQTVLKGLRSHPAKVYLFGSQVTGMARKTSDIDIAIWSEKELPDGLMSDIRQALDDSCILATVDLVDLSTSDPAFRQRVLKEGVLWS